ncbi:MAG: 30S ribosomal protein S4 [Thermoprotei archaeon]|nr:30S ribosomal protein S4 [Thermoprotei archaeon]
MGDPRKSRRKWRGPRHPWIKTRLVKEIELVGKYGLKNKRELWLAETLARTFRHRARAILGLPEEVREREFKALTSKLYKLGLVGPDATLDTILGLTAEHILERRLQTIVYRRGLAGTIYEARQLIAHGHIAVRGVRVTSPGYIVSRDEEQFIDYAPGSPLRERVKSEVAL